MRLREECPPAGYCEYCERMIYTGEEALRDQRYQYVRSYLCPECFAALSKLEVAEWLGGSFQEVG